MRFLKSNILILVLLCQWSLLSSAKEVQDTLTSPSRDRVIVKYNITEHDGQMTITFSNVKKQIGNRHREQYELSDVRVLFFERGGSYKDATFDSDISTESLMIPSDLIRYHASEEGYVFLDDEGFAINVNLFAEQATLSLPIYLVHYEKARRYKVFAKCGNLNIDLTKRTVQNKPTGKTTEVVQKQITQTEEVEVDSETITPAMEAESHINALKALFAQEPSYSQLKNNGYHIDNLHNLEAKILDKDLQRSIQEVIQEYDSRLQVAQVEDDDNNRCNINKEEKEREEKQARQDMDYINERLDNIKDLSESDLAELKSASNELRKKAHSIDNEELAQQMKETSDRCDKEIKKIDDAKKRRNIWMIIGGILLAILMFIGNIFFQQFRHMRNIKSMEDAQNKIAKRAENEARRRAQSMVRGKVNRVQGQVRQKSRDAVRNGVKNGVNNVAKGIGKNKKGLSI